MHAEHNDLLVEAIPEMMKNLLLVMETAGAFGSSQSEDKTHLWIITWDRIDLFLPGLRQEVSRSKTPVARLTLPPTQDIAHQIAPNVENVENVENVDKIVEIDQVVAHATVESPTVADQHIDSNAHADPDPHAEAVAATDAHIDMALKNDTFDTHVVETVEHVEKVDNVENVEASKVGMFGVFNDVQSGSDAGSFFNNFPPLPADVPAEDSVQNPADTPADNPLTSMTNEFPILPIPVSPVQVKVGRIYHY